MDIDSFKKMSAEVTDAASALRGYIKAPVVIIIPCSPDAEEPMMMGLACNKSEGDPDTVLTEALGRALKSAEARIIGSSPGDGTVSVGVVGKDGRITTAPKGKSS